MVAGAVKISRGFMVMPPPPALDQVYRGSHDWSARASFSASKGGVGRGGGRGGPLTLLCPGAVERKS